LKRLFEKCTTPVSAIAISIGKNIAKTGAKMVPNPKPEKNVKTAVKNAAKHIITISIQTYFKIYIAKTGCMVAFGVVFINVKMVVKVTAC